MCGVSGCASANRAGGRYLWCACGIPKGVSQGPTLRNSSLKVCFCSPSFLELIWTQLFSQQTLNPLKWNQKSILQERTTMPNTMPLSVVTSSQQCIRAIASDSRIMLSSCRTVILHDDFVTPEPSLWRRRLYCSTIKSSDSLEIYTDWRSKNNVSYRWTGHQFP